MTPKYSVSEENHQDLFVIGIESAQKMVSAQQVWTVQGNWIN